MINYIHLTVDVLNGIHQSGLGAPPSIGQRGSQVCMSSPLLMDWWRTNNLSLNVEKTKQMIVGFRRAPRDHSLLDNVVSVEIIQSSRFLGVHFVVNLMWTISACSMAKKAPQLHHGLVWELGPEDPLVDGGSVDHWNFVMVPAPMNSCVFAVWKIRSFRTLFNSV